MNRGILNARVPVVQCKPFDRRFFVYSSPYCFPYFVSISKIFLRTIRSLKWRLYRFFCFNKSYKKLSGAVNFGSIIHRLKELYPARCSRPELLKHIPQPPPNVSPSYQTSKDPDPQIQQPRRLYSPIYYPSET